MFLWLEGFKLEIPYLHSWCTNKVGAPVEFDVLIGFF